MKSTTKTLKYMVRLQVLALLGSKMVVEVLAQTLALMESDGN